MRLVARQPLATSRR